MVRGRWDPGLYLVTDQALAGDRSVQEIVGAALRGGVTMVQLREKERDTRSFVALAQQLGAELRSRGVPLIINDRLDVALAAGASGVHIGQQDMPYGQARRILGPEAIIGLSVETLEQAEEAEQLDCDYLGVSPIFPTPTKTDVGTSWGLEGLRALRRRTAKVLVAIGGINADNAAAVLNAGADGIAVVSAICASREPEAAARALWQTIQRHRRRSP